MTFDLLALSAGHGRLVAQFLTERLVLAALGVVAELAIALPAMQFLERLIGVNRGILHERLALWLPTQLFASCRQRIACPFVGGGSGLFCACPSHVPR